MSTRLARVIDILALSILVLLIAGAIVTRERVSIAIVIVIIVHVVVAYAHIVFKRHWMDICDQALELIVAALLSFQAVQIVFGRVHFNIALSVAYVLIALAWNALMIFMRGGE